MRNIWVAMLMIALFSFTYASEKTAPNKSQQNAVTKKPVTISEAMRLEKPVIVFFTKSIACDCTKKNCMAAEKSFHEIIDTTKTEFTIVKIDVSTDEKIARDYKVVAPPTILIFDKTGKETARLNSWEVNAEKFNAALATVQLKTRQQINK